MPRFPIAIESQGQAVLGVFHTPAGSGKAPAVLFLHGFASTKVGPHRLLVKAAEALAAQGVAALRFDLRGCGDSEGDSRDMTLDGHVADARAALAWLRARPEVDPQRVALLGFSLGGAVAALLAGEEPGLRAVVLWAPAANFDRWEDEGHVARLQGQIDLGGNVIGRAFYRSLAGVDPVAALARSEAPVWLAYGTADEWGAEQAAVYQAALPADRLTLHTVAGADHDFASAHWEQELIDRTVSWLAAALG